MPRGVWKNPTLAYRPTVVKVGRPAKLGNDHKLHSHTILRTIDYTIKKSTITLPSYFYIVASYSVLLILANLPLVHSFLAYSSAHAGN